MTEDVNEPEVQVQPADEFDEFREWHTRGIVLEAASGRLHDQHKLARFLTRAQVEFPNASIYVTGDGTLRVTEYTDPHRVGPYLDWRD